MSWLRMAAVSLGALVVLAIVVALSGVSPFAAIAAGVRGAFGDASAVQGTLMRMTPLLLSGLGVAIGLRAGLFNIGVEGQLIVGALAAATCGILLTGLPAGLHVPICLLAGGLAGLIWALPAGVLKIWRGAHEVITTIMMNWIALKLTDYLVKTHLHRPNAQQVTTVFIQPSATMPDVGPASSGLLLALACAVVLAWWMVRTVGGFELRATGANPDAAAAAGVNTRRVMVWSMAVSGMLAGLAGAVQVCAFEHRFYSGISPGYGFDSLAVALIAMANPLGVIVSSGLFGALSQGAQFAQVQVGMPKEIAAVVQGIVILVAAAIGWQRRRRAD